MLTRLLEPDEVPSVWAIDRREYIANAFRLRDGELVLEPYDFDVPGWQAGQPEETTPRLVAIIERGGRAWAIIRDETAVAACVTDVQPAGSRGDLIQLAWLHVSRDDRGQGLGSQLFEHAIALAHQRGVAGLYISAAPSENTVKFYLGRGAKLAPEPDPRLFAFEPEDIHLEWRG